VYGLDQRKILLLASRVPRQREDTYGTRSITIPPPCREDGQTSCGHSVLCKGNGRHLARRFSLRVFTSTASSSPEQHHTYDFFTEVWSGESWLQDEDAIDAICHSPLIATEDITSERFALALVEEPGGPGLGTESVFETLSNWFFRDFPNRSEPGLASVLTARHTMTLAPAFRLTRARMAEFLCTVMLAATWMTFWQSSSLRSLIFFQIQDRTRG